MFDFNYLKKYSSKENIFIAGCDEVGRGPLAGPVVAACAILHQKHFNKKEFIEFLEVLSFLGVSDSKKITNIKREEIVENLGIDILVDQTLNIEISKNTILQIRIHEISVEMIDEINILNASLLAMKDSFENVCNDNFNGVVLIDGNKKFQSKFQQIEMEAVVKGDSKSLLIGLASICAKVYRDRLMNELAKSYPGYFWEKNAGYGTAEHLIAIGKLGITPVHRKTFRGVKEHYEKRG